MAALAVNGRTFRLTGERLAARGPDVARAGAEGRGPAGSASRAAGATDHSREEPPADRVLSAHARSAPALRADGPVPPGGGA
jgi:hypothetical protein